MEPPTPSTFVLPVRRVYTIQCIARILDLIALSKHTLPSCSHKQAHSLTASVDLQPIEISHCAATPPGTTVSSSLSSSSYTLLLDVLGLVITLSLLICVAISWLSRAFCSIYHCRNYRKYPHVFGATLRQYQQLPASFASHIVIIPLCRAILEKPFFQHPGFYQRPRNAARSPTALLISSLNYSDRSYPLSTRGIAGFCL
ncbi:hypothetical protein F4825DRAFT_127011 [Nemania diffusa]|nr:hypothetical protein F4825DRAFT_127011 [Nemania diffusa]